MNKKNWSSLIFGITSLFFLTTSAIQAETVLEEINRTGILKVGIRNDVIPFGYLDNQDNLAGICFDLVKLIETEIPKYLDRDIIATRLLISSLYNRFEIVQDELVHLECGPNTIRKLEQEQVSFSKPFFVSGVRFLVKEESARKLINSQGKDFRIGVLRYTSTEELIKQKYPQATFEYFQGDGAASQAFELVKAGQLDAFINDTILLTGQSVAQRFPIGETTEYVLTPEQPFSCEKYGFILPKNNPDWSNLVNSVIQSTQTQEVFQRWFSTFNSDYGSDVLKCPKELDDIVE